MSDKIKTWSETAAQNNAAIPNGAPEGWDSPDVNEVIREVMASVASWYVDAEFCDVSDAYTVSEATGTISIAGFDQTAIFVVGSRIRVIGDTNIDTHVDTVTFTGGNTDITLPASPAMPANVDGIEIATARGTREAAYFRTGSTTGLIPTFDDIDTVLGVTIPLGDAAERTVGTASANIPDVAALGVTPPLGDAALKTIGTGAAEVPTNADIVKPAVSKTERIINQTNVSVEEDVVGLTGISVPGSPDGFKWYRVMAFLYGDYAATDASDTAVGRIYQGSTGDKGDTEIGVCAIWVDDAMIGTPDFTMFIHAVFQPAASAKVGLSLQGSSVDVDLLADEKTAWLWIEEIAS